MRFGILLLTLFVTAMPASAQRVGSYGKAPAAPNRERDLSAMKIEQHLGAQVPLDLVFRNEQNQEITLGSCVGGKPTILVLAFYRCRNTCPLVLNGLFDCVKKIEGDVGDRFNIVAVSFDPKEGYAIAYDKKESYVAEYGRPNAGKGIHFLVGKQEAINELTEAVGFFYEQDKQRKDIFNHPSCIMILTPHGKLSQYFSGISYDDKEVCAALEKAGGGDIGKEVKPSAFLVYLCYELDPESGRYTLSVMKGLRLIFGTMVLCLAVWLIRNWRRPTKAVPPEVKSESAAV